MRTDPGFPVQLLQQMDIFSNDVDRMIRQAEQAQAAGEPADDPMENWVIPSGLSFLRAEAADFADIWSLPPVQPIERHAVCECWNNASGAGSGRWRPEVSL